MADLHEYPDDFEPPLGAEGTASSAQTTDETDAPPVVDPDSAGELTLAESWPTADIEQAYLKALEAMGDIPWEEGRAESPVEATAGGPASNVEPLPDATPAAPTGPNSPNGEVNVPPPEQGLNASIAELEAPLAPVAQPAEVTARKAKVPPEEQVHVTPGQVIEAALFVGGMPLTAKRLSTLLRGSVDAASVERTIDELNEQYMAQARPYEIRLRDGGYRLELRPEFDRLRHRVYGSGPREVRLSQEALEVLALVAYQQPISQEEIESHGRQNAGNLLRQLLRRELVSIERGTGGRKNVKYRTTDRFLSVFGIGSLSELPQPEDLARK